MEMGTPSNRGVAPYKPLETQEDIAVWSLLLGLKRETPYKRGTRGLQ